MNIQLQLKPIQILATAQHPIIISGPCSAETETQVLETCQQLAQTNQVNLLRAGIWKPRTRPNSFEGVGSIGLQWLKKAGKANNLPVTVEVANVKHVYECLKMGVDVLWLGARTTVNPFAVQEIADALNGVDIPVMVKNPVNPDLALWIGALERLNRAGITQLAAIHRGFSYYGKTPYRNPPQWEIPIELKRQLPNLPLLCDPSHICGRRDLLQSVSQKAMDLGFDGLMLESHMTPDKALSDAKQQVTPANFARIIDNLIFRTADISDEALLKTLEEWREDIDAIDEKVVATLAQRMEIARKIGRVKKANSIQILQPERWNHIIKTRTQDGVSQQLTKKFMLALYNLIHSESIRHQTDVMNEEQE